MALPQALFASGRVAQITYHLNRHIAIQEALDAKFAGWTEKVSDEQYRK